MVGMHRHPKFNPRRPRPLDRRTLRDPSVHRLRFALAGQDGVQPGSSADAGAAQRFLGGFSAGLFLWPVRQYRVVDPGVRKRLRPHGVVGHVPEEGPDMAAVSAVRLMQRRSLATLSPAGLLEIRVR